MLSEKVEYLEKENERLLNQYKKAFEELNKERRLKKAYHDMCLMLIPEKVFTHKKRRNTTVKFRDGSSVTVTRMQGEKDCIETAIAYCIMKQLMTKQYLANLIKNKEEH